MPPPAPCVATPFQLPPTVYEYFGSLMYEGGLSPLEIYGITMGEVHGVSQKCFEGLAEFDFFGVENRFNDASATTGTPLVKFTYDGPMMGSPDEKENEDASENGERKLYSLFPMIHEGIETFEDMGYEICKDAGGEYVTLDGTVTMDAESSFWFRTFSPAANLLKAPGLYRYGYLDPYDIKYWFEMYSFQSINQCGIGYDYGDDTSDSGDRKLANDKIDDSSQARRTNGGPYYNTGPFPLDVCIPYVEFRNRYACVPKKNACTDEEIATIITTSTVTMEEIPMIHSYEYGYDEDAAPSDDPKRKMTANKKASKYQPKQQQQKKSPDNDVSSTDSKRKLEHWPEPVSLFSKCTDVPTVTKVGKSAKASKAPKLRNRE